MEDKVKAEKAAVKDVTATQDEEAEIKILDFRGMPMHANFDADIMEQVVEFKPDPTDIFVVTYPKCGTTWTQYIVWEIINEGAPPPGTNKMVFKQFPFLEATGVDNLHELPRPRLMKTHLPFHLQPYHPSAKYIYVVRNPWDCCVSYYHHEKNLMPEGKILTFEKFFDSFIQGKVAFGDFFDHVHSWYTHKDDPNILFLTYENMTADKKGTMLAVAKFLGDRYYDILKNNEEVLNNCLKHSDFKYVKDLGVFFPKFEGGQEQKSKIPDKATKEKMREALGSVDKDNVDLEKYKKLEFYRKGIVGDWINHFSEDQIQKFNDYISSKARDSEEKDMWLQYGQPEKF